MTDADSVLIEREGRVTIVSINRPHCRNAVDGATARKLYDAFLAFDADKEASVAVFTGTGGYFCAGADLKAVAAGDPNKKREIGGHDSIAPMGPSRLRLAKPGIAAIEGFAVAGGMELALWADMRVVAEDATFGIFCRRFGVPLIDLGTVRLPRLIGHSQAIDLILTGRRMVDRKSTRLNSSHRCISYAVFCLKKKNHRSVPHFATKDGVQVLPLGLSATQNVRSCKTINDFVGDILPINGQDPVTINSLDFQR